MSRKVTWNYIRKTKLTRIIREAKKNGNNKRDTTATAESIIIKKKEAKIWWAGKWFIIAQSERKTLLFISSFHRTDATCYNHHHHRRHVLFPVSQHIPNNSNILLCVLFLNQIHFSIIFFIILFITFRSSASLHFSFSRKMWNCFVGSSTISWRMCNVFMYEQHMKWLRRARILNDAEEKKKLDTGASDHNNSRGTRSSLWFTVESFCACTSLCYP